MTSTLKSYIINILSCKISPRSSLIIGLLTSQRGNIHFGKELCARSDEIDCSLWCRIRSDGPFHNYNRVTCCIFRC